MERISEIIGKTYQKYAEKLKNTNISISLDFPDTTISTKDKERVEKDLEKSIKLSIDRKKDANLKIAIKNGSISIQNTNIILDNTTCKKLSSEHFKIKSRVGFGTTITINI